MSTDHVIAQVDEIRDWYDNQDDYELYVNGDRFKKVDTTGCCGGRFYRWILTTFCGYSKISGEERFISLIRNVNDLVTPEVARLHQEKGQLLEFLEKLQKKAIERLAPDHAAIHDNHQTAPLAQAIANVKQVSRSSSETSVSYGSSLSTPSPRDLSVSTASPRPARLPFAKSWVYIRDNLMKQQVPKYVEMRERAALYLAVQDALKKKPPINEEEATAIFHGELNKRLPEWIVLANKRTWLQLKDVLNTNGIAPLFVGQIGKTLNFNIDPEQFQKHVYEKTKEWVKEIGANEDILDRLKEIKEVNI